MNFYAAIKKRSLKIWERRTNEILAAIPKRVRSNDELLAVHRHIALLVRTHGKADGVQRHFQFGRSAQKHGVDMFHGAVVDEAILEDGSFLNVE